MFPITLWFERTSVLPELYRCQFQNVLRVEDESLKLDSIRGRFFQPPATGSFLWTSAVQAFCILALRTYVGSQGITGGAGSPAASLDYSIAKEPNWLLDMFGVQADGRSQARLIFRRANPERKRAGPVSVSLNERRVGRQGIEVYLNGEFTKSASVISELANSIESTCFPNFGNSGGAIQGSGEVVDDSYSELNDLPKASTIFDLILEETFFGINELDIFSPSDLLTRLTKIVKNKLFLSLTGRAHSRLVHGVKSQHNELHRLGRTERGNELERGLKEGPPISVVFPYSLSAVSALFHYLKFYKGYALELSYSFPHAVDIALKLIDRSFKRRPEVCVLGIGPSASVLSSRATSDYRPLMLMPRLRQAIIAPKSINLRNAKGSTLSLNNSDYFFIKDEPSNPMFQLKSLIDSGAVDERKIGKHHLEPDEVVKILSAQDPSTRAISFFPHYRLNQIYNSCQVLRSREILSGNSIHQEVVLFAHRVLFEGKPKNRAQLLEIALRDAWLDLYENPDLVRRICQDFIKKQDFVEFFLRNSGMLHMKSKVEREH